MSSEPRIAVLGSCVTRQAFLHHEGPEPWRLQRPVLYQARSSLVSLLSPPLEPPEPLLAAIDNPFEQRATRDDFQRSFWSKLAASQPDLLILDLVDERFDLMASGAAPGDARYATLNAAIDSWDRRERRRARHRLLRRLRRLVTDVAEGGLPRLGFRRLRRMTGEVNQLWHGAAAEFARRLRVEHPRLRVALHLAPLPTDFEDGGRGDPAHPDAWWLRKPMHLSALRSLFASYGQRLRELFPEASLLQAPREVHLLKRGHPWGEAPWHYAEGYYRELVGQIRRMA